MNYESTPTSLIDKVSDTFKGADLFKVYFWALLIVGFPLVSMGVVWPLLGYPSTVIVLFAVIYLFVGVPTGLYLGIKKLIKSYKELKESK